MMLKKHKNICNLIKKLNLHNMLKGEKSLYIIVCIWIKWNTLSIFI